MKMYNDCIPCFYRVAIEALEAHGVPPSEQKPFLARFSEILYSLPEGIPAPEVSGIITRILAGLGRRRDVYYDVKKRSTRLALDAYPRLKRLIAVSADPLCLALEFAMAGNIIDSGLKKNIDVAGEIEKFTAPGATKGRVFMDYAPFKAALKKARTVLVVADNAGETVFDRILIEEIHRLYPGKKIVYAVRSSPALNDALLEDAFDAGLDRVASVIASGSDFPGTAVERCSPEFQDYFRTACMVISKGQGNYETLTETEREIFFMLMLKCPVVARHSGRPEGSYLLWRRRAPKKSGEKK